MENTSLTIPGSQIHFSVCGRTLGRRSSCVTLGLWLWRWSFLHLRSFAFFSLTTLVWVTSHGGTWPLWQPFSSIFCECPPIVGSQKKPRKNIGCHFIWRPGFGFVAEYLLRNLEIVHSGPTEWALQALLKRLCQLPYIVQQRSWLSFQTHWVPSLRSTGDQVWSAQGGSLSYIFILWETS